jgi:DnaJ-class molecular chaperone
MSTLYTCERCNGECRIVCPDCNGSGADPNGSIATALIPRGHPHETELRALQEDARRCIRQAETLIHNNPARTKSYEAQRQAMLAVIEVAARRLA